MSDLFVNDLTLPGHLYVHIPFCRSKCVYCDFFSCVSHSAGECVPVVDHTLKVADDLAARASIAGLSTRGLSTLYVGGGTPTVLGAGLPRLIRSLAAVFSLTPEAEVTVEANPDSLTPELLEDLACAGVTRVSLGVQFLNDDILAWLGRPHTSADAWRAMTAVQDACLELSVDLMAGIPGVSRSEWAGMLDRITDSGVRHVSVYPLTVEERTPLAQAVDRGEKAAPDDDEVAQAMVDAAECLTRAGLVRYEVANYAVPGYESRHNCGYWTGHEYLALGGGAHGMLSASHARMLGIEDHAEAVSGQTTVGRVRYAYERELFFSPIPTMIEHLLPADAAREDAMLGLRLAVGIDEGLACRAGIVDVLESLMADGLVAHNHGRWQATGLGWLLGNEIFARVWNRETR